MGITLLDMLQNAGLITREQFDEALKNRVLYGGKIGTSLIELGHIGEHELARFLSSKLAVPFIAAEKLLAIPPQVIELIPRHIAVTYRAIPIHREKKRLYLVMADPTDLKAIDEISFITGFIVKPVIAPEVRLVQALGKYYGIEVDGRYQQIIERIEEEKSKVPPPAPEPPVVPRTEGPIVPPEPPVVPQAEGPIVPPEPPVVPRAEGPIVPVVPQSAPEPSRLPPREEELEEVEVVDDEEWIRRVGLYSTDTVSKTLAWSNDREEIATILIDYLRQKFDTAALFVIRRDAAFGWKGVSRRTDINDIENINIPFAGPSVLKTVAEGGSYYLGPIPDTPLNNMMLQGLGGSKQGSVLLLPLVISGRIVNILYLQGGEAALADQFMDLHRLLIKAVLAFEILIFREKILML